MPLSPLNHSIYTRHWVAARRRDYFFGQSCARCGAQENLELHHRDPATKVSHKIWSWAPTRRLAELAKCDILCHNCHRRKFTQEKIDFILASQLSTQELATLFNVHPSTINRLKSHKLYRPLT